MSATMFTVNFSFTVEDRDHLPRDVEPEDVLMAVEAVMRAAGDRYVETHQHLFRVGIT